MNENAETISEILETPILETAEILGVSEQLFNQRMDSLENLFVVQVIGLALIAGCVLASVVMRWFHVR